MAIEANEDFKNTNVFTYGYVVMDLNTGELEVRNKKFSLQDRDANVVAAFITQASYGLGGTSSQTMAHLVGNSSPAYFTKRLKEVRGVLKGFKIAVMNMKDGTTQPVTADSLLLTNLLAERQKDNYEKCPHILNTHLIQSIEYGGGHIYEYSNIRLEPTQYITGLEGIKYKGSKHDGVHKSVMVAGPYVPPSKSEIPHFRHGMLNHDQLVSLPNPNDRYTHS